MARLSPSLQRPPLYMARILIEPRAHSITHLDFEVRGGFLF
jgi:hypothetical protein